MKNRKKKFKMNFSIYKIRFFSLDVFPPSGNFCHVDKDTFLNIDFFGACRNSEIRSISQKNLQHYTKIDFTLNIARIKYMQNEMKGNLRNMNIIAVVLFAIRVKPSKNGKKAN